MNSNEKKAATLGMPHGTATNRLRKNILFYLLKKHDENVCARCQQPIETVDDLSIEHLKPWEGISAELFWDLENIELFWDLENIAFSHLHCNRPHRNLGGTPRRVEAPQGQSYCFGCEQNKDVKEFHAHSQRWNGVSEECKDCKSKRNALRDRKVQSDVGIVAERHLAKV
jgi:hypothetical protein